jgi:hypothetical protein
MQPTRRRFLALSIAATALRSGPAQGAVSSAPEFLDVPNASRLRMHWHIFGPAWTAEECERELKLMAASHVGGVVIFPTYPVAVDDPARGIVNHPYESAEFLEVLRSVLATCKKLGLTADMRLGAGSPFGGPSVRIADGAKSLHRATVPVTAGPPAAMPELEPEATVLGAFFVYPGGCARIALDAAKPSVGAQTSNGELQIFYSLPSRMQVKRTSLGGEGLVLDPYNAAAFGHWLQAVGDKVIENVPEGSVRSVFCESLEVDSANWTDDFPKIFLRKRGYDLTDHLPALFDRNHGDSRDLRCDFWRTLAELAVEGYIRPLAEWTHRKGVTAQVETHGTPPVSLAGYQAIDMPAGGHYDWKELNTSRWASSGARLAGKRTVLAEAWKGIGMPDRFGDSLEQLKLCSDLHFLSGVNALQGTAYAYSPSAAGTPGWTPAFGPVVNHTQPYWPYFSHFADYVNRASWILQQGQPIADVAVYLPLEDAMAEGDTADLSFHRAVRDRLSSNGAPPDFGLANALHYESDVVKTIVTNGYAFDAVDTFAFREMRVEERRLKSGDGLYSTLVLPNLTGIDVDSLRKIRAFVDQGGALIATRRLPDTAYGMQDRARNRSEVEQILRELFGTIPDGVALHQHRFGNGVAIFSRDERRSFLNALRWHQPDIAFAEASPHVGFVHRRTPDRDYYFLSNTSEQSRRLDATFRVSAKKPELWDLKTGTVQPIVAFDETKGGLRLTLELGPLESRVIAFAEDGRSPVASDTDLDLEPDRSGWAARVFENRAYYVQRPRGREDITVSGIPEPAVLVPRWRLRFEDAALAPADLDELKSWTDLPGARFFSGRGVYEAEFPFARKLAEDVGVMLDLGTVRETAEVWLNDAPAGVAWMRPYRFDVTHLLQVGANRLRIAVSNLLINRVLGLGPIDYSAVYERYGRRFPPGDEWQTVRDPLPSGLLGPVWLVFYKILRGGSLREPDRKRRPANRVVA